MIDSYSARWYGTSRKRERRPNRRSRFRLVFMTAAILAAASPASACNVPVFRYALERWQPDPYEMFVFHQDPLTAEQMALIDSLRPKTKDSCNLTMSIIDWNTISAEIKKELLAKYEIPRFPWVIIRYPLHVESDGPAYSGPLQADSLRNLLDSPARTDLARRLLKGESAVWLFVESGDLKKDNDIEARLKTWLGTLEKKLKLTALTNSPKDKLLREDLPLKISFSILRLSRTDAAEKHFVHTLRHMEKDLSRTAEPIVVPVFGRGLALYAIRGKGITEGNIGEAAWFLTDACSCEVKRLNPGVDLLITAEWEDPKLAPAQPGKPEPSAAPEPVTIPQPKAEKDKKEGRSSQQDSDSMAFGDATSTTASDVESSETSEAFFLLGSPVAAAGIGVLLLGAIAVYFLGRK
jgi:hypothetical protein